MNVTAFYALWCPALRELPACVVLYFRTVRAPWAWSGQNACSAVWRDPARGPVQGMFSELFLGYERLPLHSCDRQGLWTLFRRVFIHPHSHEARIAVRTLCASNSLSNNTFPIFPRKKLVAKALLPQSSS